jgi:ATP-dependent Clp protease ATP-binding subunit ClpA
MTSNAGSSQNLNSIGFGQEAKKRNNKIQDALRETFRPEFLNRVDEVVIFDSLTEKELTQIVDLMLKDTQNVLNDKNIKMYVSNEAKKYIVENGTDIKYGARPLRRAVERLIEDELSERILKQELKNGQKIYIDIKDGKLTFEAKDADKK